MDYQKKIADELHELNGYMKKIVKSLDKPDMVVNTIAEKTDQGKIGFTMNE